MSTFNAETLVRDGDGASVRLGHPLSRGLTRHVSGVKKKGHRGLEDFDRELQRYANASPAEQILLTLIADDIASAAAHCREQRERFDRWRTQAGWPALPELEAEEASRFQLQSPLAWQLLGLIVDYDRLLTRIQPYHEARLLPETLYRYYKSMATRISLVLTLPERLELSEPLPPAEPSPPPIPGLRQ